MTWLTVCCAALMGGSVLAVSIASADEPKRTEAQKKLRDRVLEQQAQPDGADEGQVGLEMFVRVAPDEADYEAREAAPAK